MSPHTSRLRAGLVAAGLFLVYTARLLGIGAPVLSSPVTGTGYMPHPGFNWQPVSGAASYTIEVSSNAGFTAPLIATRANLTIPRYVPPSPLRARS